MKALSLHVTGVVQGVGFRPFVYNLARELGLEGWVLNSSEGVFCLVQGDSGRRRRASRRLLREQAPAMAVIESVVAEEVEPEALAGFEIRESESRRRRDDARLARHRDVPGVRGRAASTPPTGATATRSSTARTAARASPSSTTSRTTGR